MELKQEILDKLEIIYNAVKDRCVCMYIGGSYGINYLNSYHDIDVFIVCASSDDKEYVFTTIKRNNIELKTLAKNLKEEYNLMVLTTSLRNKLQFYEGSYQFNFPDVKILFGEQIDIAKDIFTYKSLYIEALNYSIEKIEYFYKKQNTIIKELYHVLTGVYMLQNGSYDLTSEQIENINICHEAENQNKMRVLLKECKKWLSTQK